jgi:membrane protease YdiL (CAAX protease family)
MAQSKLKPWHGLVALAFVIVMCILFEAKVVEALSGGWGVIVVELFIVMVAVVGVFAFGGNRTDLFPMAKPKLKYAAGSVVLGVGMFFLVSAVSVALSILFPAETASASDVITGYVDTNNFWMAVLVPAVAAGVCEELLFRGLILSSFKTVRPTWLKVLIVGVLFGVFHLDPLRAVGTAITGAFFTFVALRTGNIIVAMLLHTLLDFIGFLSAYLAGGVNDAWAQTASAGWFDVFVTLAIAAVPFVVGLLLMRKAKNQAVE